MRPLKSDFTEADLFRFFRVGFGIFLFLHFAFLFGSLEILFSGSYLALRDGGPFNLLSYVEGAWMIKTVNGVACLLAICVCLDFKRRSACFLLLYIHACYLLKNPMILNVSYDYLGWLLLALGLIPETSQGTAEPGPSAIPTYLFTIGWLIFGFGYTFNGILKIQSPIWLDGSALGFIIPQDRLLADEVVRGLLMSLPPLVLKVLTWATAYAELLCLPLIAFKRTRPVIWFIILALHLNALVIFKIKDLSMVMIFFSLFLGINLFGKAMRNHPSSPKFLTQKI